MRLHFLWCWMLFAVPAAAAPGDFSIPATIPLGHAQLRRLRELVGSDPEAAALAKLVSDHARPLLSAQPQPLEVIHYEGLVNTNPKRLATVKKLQDMEKVARLVRYWQVSGDEKAAATLRRFITAWTSTYRLTGNDVNENKFYPMLVAYAGLRDTFPEEERKKVDTWVDGLGMLHLKGVNKSNHLTNRYSKHVRLLALCGLVLGREEWLEKAQEGIRRFVRKSLYKDGSSLDLKHRDTLTYHCSALRPPMQLAIILGDRGRELYAWQGPPGGSLKKSVDFVIPYAMSRKTHAEWVHTKVKLDRDRAAAGIEKYRTGRPFDPQDALRLMEEASAFDPELVEVVRHLTGSKAKRYPTWQTLVNAAVAAPGR